MSELQDLVSSHFRSSPLPDLSQAHIYLDGYTTILNRWRAATERGGENCCKLPNELYREQVNIVIGGLVAFNPKSLTFYLESPISSKSLTEKVDRRNKRLSSMDFSNLIFPFLLTAQEITKNFPKVGLVVACMRAGNTIMRDIVDRVKKEPESKSLHVIFTENYDICARSVPNWANIVLASTSENPEVWEAQRTMKTCRYQELNSMIEVKRTAEKLADSAAWVFRNQTWRTFRELGFQYSTRRNGAPTVFLPLIPIVENVEPFQVGSIYRRCAYGSFLRRATLPEDTPIEVYWQEGNIYKAHLVRSLDRSICKTQAEYWSKFPKNASICEDLMAVLEPDCIMRVSWYIEDLISDKHMKMSTPNLEAKQVCCYLIVLFHSLWMLSECEFGFPPDPIIKLLTKVHPGHCVNYLK